MKLKKILAGVMAVVMAAGSLLAAPVETKAANVDASKVYDATEVVISDTSKKLVAGTTCQLSAYALGLLVDGSTVWNSMGGDQFLLKDDFDVAIRFYNEAFIRDNNNWSNFVFEILGGADTKGITLRSDNYGWLFGDGSQEPTFVNERTWGDDWSNWANICNKQFVVLNAKKTDANTVVVKITFEESEAVETYTITYPSGVPSEMRIQVGADGGKVWLSEFVDNASIGLQGNTITWTSSNENAATVDANGKVTAVAEGTTVITATCGEKTASCSIDVQALAIPITGIDVTTDKTEIKVGTTALLTTTINPADTTDDKTVTYTSSDEKVATVDVNGKVTAVAPGTATITATVGEFTDTVKITVPAVAITDIKLSVDKTALDKGDIINIVATVNPADTTEDKTITWTSSNEKVATVDANGTVTAVGGGNATITAAIGDVKAEVTFKVTAQETVVKKTKIADFTIADFLSVQSDGVQLKKGHTYTFTFNAKGTDATSTNLYETPCYFIYTNSENKFNTEDYKELVFARGDVWCWFNADTAQNPDALPDGATFTRTYPENWDVWTAAMKAGAECKIVVKYDGSTVTATYTVADASTVASFPVSIPSGSKLYLGLTGEKVALTDITVADEYVTTISGTGDVLTVLPVVLVILGGAVVLVASKKRFA